MTKPYREESRANYYGTGNGSANIEQINCGSLQRIADATELMAKNHIRLQEDLNWYKKRYQNQVRENDRLRKQVAAYKGHVNRLKKLQGTAE